MIGKLVAATTTLVGLTVGSNWFFLNVPLAEVLASDSRNTGVVIHAYSKWLIQPNHLVLDIWNIGGEKSRLDVDRVLFHASVALKRYSFESVTLAFRGKSRFVLDGSYFSTLGNELNSGEKPLYFVRTLPENLKYPDGARAFQQWTGGALIVLNRQFEDHNEFHNQWYARDMSEEFSQSSN